MNERDIFLAAIDIADPAERAAWVAQACGSDAELRTQVEQLLKSHEQASQFLETPAGADISAVNQTILSDGSGKDRTSGEAVFRSFLQPATRPGWLGRLGHYEIEEILGRGAFGIVARAFDEKLHRVVAIKLMSPELASTSPPRKRFLREARTAAAVMHENIVAIHAVEEEPVPYLVMEYIPGRTLQQRMDEHGPLEVQEVLRIGQQVAAGLAAAHAVNLIHRDIKPSNILLTESPGERAKISDFGLARAVDDATLTSSGLIAGTPMYMAPEQARGETLDHRADLFSLGSVLYQMASGRPPFRASSTVAVLKRVCDDTPRPLDDVIPGIPGWLETIIFKLLEKEPDDRYQTAQEVADLLARCQRELEHGGRVTCVAERSGTGDTQVWQARKRTRQPSRKKVVRWLAGGVVAMAAVIGLLLPNSGKESADPDSITASGTAAVSSTTGTPANAVATTTWQGWPADAPPPAIAPFDAEQAKAHQEAWAKYLDIPVEYENSIGMKFRLMPPGEFLMGSTPEEIEAARMWALGEEQVLELNSEAPQHKVVLTQPIYVGATEVTQAQYEHIMGTNPSHFSATGQGKEEVAGLETGNHPVEMVSWNDATEFCAKLSQHEELKPFYFRFGENVAPLDGTGYRLPTEAEWENACRAGTTTRFWSGNETGNLFSIAWFNNSAGGRTHAVGELKANPFGLSDMHGNVAEWVHDFWAPAYFGQFTQNPAVDPSNPYSKGPRRPQHRGGNSACHPSHCRSSARHAAGPTAVYLALGFRVAITADAVKKVVARKPTMSRGFESTGWHGWPAEAPPPAIAPFDAAQAKQHQEAWAKYLGVPVEYENSIGMKFRLIPPGEFTMGSTPEEVAAVLKVPLEYHKRRKQIQSEAPQHKAILTQPVYVGVTEVTQAQYEQVTRNNPSYYSASGEGQDAVAGLENGNRPVETVSWNDATEFCSKLSQQEKLKPFYLRSGETVTAREGTGYRLPTEAEWEYFCRAGTTTRLWSGDRDEDLIAAGWGGSNSGGRTHVVGELPANAFGLFDTHGNLWEWVEDSWNPAFYEQFAGNAAVNPFNPFDAGPERVIRGGNVAATLSQLRSSSRDQLAPAIRVNRVGFRVVLMVDAVKQQLADEAAASPNPEPTGWHGWPADAPPPAIAPFDAAQARKHQNEWAAYLKVPVEYENSIGMKFRLIPPGEFTMGSTPEQIAAALKVTREEVWRERIQSESPQHRVILTQPVYIGMTEVTQTQYQQVMKTNPSHFSANGKGRDAVAGLETGNHPVETVSWNGAAEFCAKLGQQEELRPFYFRSGETVTPLDGTGYRLPTEAEWEFACRAGTTTWFWSGDHPKDLLVAGWFLDSSAKKTHAVGQLTSNPFGLFDVHGNVGEWVQDSWAPASYGRFSENPAIDPYSPFEAESIRVHRGGNYHWIASYCRSSARGAYDPWNRWISIGFRVVLSVDAVKQHIADEAAASPDPELTGLHGWPGEAPPPAIAPFDAAQARKYQNEWAAYLKVPVEYENSIGMKFRLIPPGEFTMGSMPEQIEEALKLAGENEVRRRQIRSEGPQHRVVLTQPVYIGVTEVTQTQYEQVAGTNPSHFSAMGEGQEEVANLETDNHPVEMVSWNDAAEFCAKLSQQERLKPFYFRTEETVTPLNGTGYRLPTEAEWEFACRAGTTTRYWNGDEASDLHQSGWYDGNSGRRPHAVGELLANPFGLFDVHGNVWEWVQDSWDPAFYSESTENSSIDPYHRFAEGPETAVRGGGWKMNQFLAQVFTRAPNLRAGRIHNVGFRVVLLVDAVKQQLADEAAASPEPEPTGWHSWPSDAPPPAIAPFDADQAKAHQEAWAKYLGVPVEYENSIGMKFRLIPPGEFTMGSTAEEVAAALKVTGEEVWRERIQSESPQHRVILTQPVYVAVTEVTQSQYEQVMGTNPSHFSDTGQGQETVANLETDNHPVEMVSWNDAAEFCARMSQQEKWKPFYFRSGETVTPLNGTGYRLPTEAEWESACRAGTTTRFWSGNQDSELLSAGWFGENSGGRTHAPGELKANPFGLSDVHGNVWEWVQDSWDPAFYGKFEGGTAIDPANPFPGGSERVVRGGGWTDGPSACRSSSRFAYRSSYESTSIGIRVVLVAESVRVSGSEPAR